MPINTFAIDFTELLPVTGPQPAGLKWWMFLLNFR